MSIVYKIGERKGKDTRVDLFHADGTKRKSWTYAWILEKSDAALILDGRIDLIRGLHWNGIGQEERECFAIARDELIDMGIIEDKAQ